MVLIHLFMLIGTKISDGKIFNLLFNFILIHIFKILSDYFFFICSAFMRILCINCPKTKQRESIRNIQAKPTQVINHIFFNH